MYLTYSRFKKCRFSPVARIVALPLIVLLCAGIFYLDRTTGTAPVQHLYYLPIILAAYTLGTGAGVATALVAVVLYHAARPPLVSSYRELDLIQIALFLAVGIVTAKLVNDANQLSRLAATDDLTGLHNLRSFEVHLRLLANATRQAREPLSMMVVDVDRLKELNDHHGHLAGAEAVRSVGRIIARNLPEHAVACRYGGDEFAIAIPRCDKAQAGKIADSLCRAVSGAMPMLLGRLWPIGTLSISIGVATEPHPHSGQIVATGEQIGKNLFRAADEALYWSKHAGRNRVHTVELRAAK